MCGGDSNFFCAVIERAYRGDWIQTFDSEERVLTRVQPILMSDSWHDFEERIGGYFQMPLDA